MVHKVAKVRETFRGHRRIRTLASDRRAAVHGRRQVRHEQIAWLRDARVFVVVTIAFFTVIVAAACAVLPVMLRPYLIGFAGASAIWWLHTTMLQATGLHGRVAGIRAEQWTIEEVRPKRTAWRLVNHVMLTHVDIDHVLLGPGGFFAIETKYRSDWRYAAREFPALARDAGNAARILRSIVAPTSATVQPLIVMWGPRLRRKFDEVFEVNGVTFCPGHRLSAYIAGQPPTVSVEAITAAWTKVDRCVERKHAAEFRTHGPVPRYASELADDVFFIAGAAIATAVSVLAPIKVHPTTMWSIATAVIASAASFVLRKRYRAARLQRVTAAVITTAIGLGVLLVVANIVLER